MEALRRIGLKGTEWAQAQVDTIRRKLFKDRHPGPHQRAPHPASDELGLCLETPVRPRLPRPALLTATIHSDHRTPIFAELFGGGAMHKRHPRLPNRLCSGAADLPAVPGKHQKCIPPDLIGYQNSLPVRELTPRVCNKTSGNSGKIWMPDHAGSWSRAACLKGTAPAFANCWPSRFAVPGLPPKRTTEGERRRISYC